MDQVHPEPTAFWPLVLANTRGDLNISPLLREFIEMTLVAPFGTAECERGFSFLTRIGAHGSSGLAPESYENHLRIIINGSRNINEFNALKIAKEYVRTHVKVDDTTAAGGRPPYKSFKYKPRIRLF